MSGPDLSLAEKRLLLALPADGSRVDSTALGDAGFATGGEALRAAGGPERHGLVWTIVEESVTYELSDEGKSAAADGLAERRAIDAVLAAGPDGLPMGELAKHVSGPEVKVAIGWLKRKGWADIDKGRLVAASADAPPAGPDELALRALGFGEGTLVQQDVAGLAERGLASEVTSKTRFLQLSPEGVAFVKSLDPAEAQGSEVNQVTPELIAKWAEMSDADKAKVHLRSFDFDVDVEPRYPGKIHPLTGLMNHIRDVFWKLGFGEISGDYVESAYWNMDALFIPQDHPAREMQDTFYLSEPARLEVDADILARGKAVHEHGGGTGSRGWGPGFSEEVSRRALLRTHTTNTTVRYLADNPTGHHKVFGLGRVFRNETMDATHLPEFHQIEGIVTEPGANFDMLIGLCKVFFAAMGFPESRFRPAYFPYTEPSMEIDVKYNGKWMELGGCGIFRPEVTEPLGVEHPVLAWGFGLERLAMMRLGLKDIRDLYISDVQWLKETPLQ